MKDFRVVRVGIVFDFYELFAFFIFCYVGIVFKFYEFFFLSFSFRRFVDFRFVRVIFLTVFRVECECCSR